MSLTIGPQPQPQDLERRIVFQDLQGRRYLLHHDNVVTPSEASRVAEFLAVCTAIILTGRGMDFVSAARAFKIEHLFKEITP